MKKIFLMAAFAGLLGSTAVANTFGDDKGKKTKKECAKDGKSCAGEKKEDCTKGEKNCCKSKASAEKASAEKATDTKTNDKK